MQLAIILDGLSSQSEMKGDGVLWRPSDYMHKARDVIESVRPLETPLGFAERSWPAYLHAIQNREYFLSTNELLLVAKSKT